MTLISTLGIAPRTNPRTHLLIRSVTGGRWLVIYRNEAGDRGIYWTGPPAGSTPTEVREWAADHMAKNRRVVGVEIVT